MKQIRILIRKRQLLAVIVIGLALCLKALVPQGYMIGSSSKFLTVEICTDASGGTKTARIEIPVEKGSAGDAGKHSKMEQPCAYSALSMLALSGADITLLATVLAFIITLGFSSVSQKPRTHCARLRPPTRAPPVFTTLS